MSEAGGMSEAELRCGVCPALRKSFGAGLVGAKLSKGGMLWKSQVCKASPALVRTLQDFETGRHGVF